MWIVEGFRHSDRLGRSARYPLTWPLGVSCCGVLVFAWERVTLVGEVDWEWQVVRRDRVHVFVDWWKVS